MARIVVGVDGSDVSRAALAFALDEARLRGARLDVVVAWHEPYSAAAIAPIATDPAVFSDAATRTLEDALASSDLTGVEIGRRVERGGPAEALLRAAEGADLLVVGSRGHGGFTGLLLGSVSQQVVHHAPCPVVVVPLRGRT
ncbi:MAG TPA: universal stress protein [Acidimicrobiales bacterium]|nr:universal stress protein [Acidimicrobiales bacterium]